MSECPTCGKGFAVHQPANGEDITPQPGDVTVCAGCAGVAIFTDDLNLRLPVEADNPLPVGLADAVLAVQVHRAIKHRMN